MLGYLVEVISGQPFEKYLVEKVIKPLGMVDTDFYVPQDKHDRFAANYSAGRRRQAQADRRSGQEPLPRAAHRELGRRRPGLDRVRLPALLQVHAEQGRARRRAPARQEDGRADDLEPSQGRHGRHGQPRASPKSTYLGIGFGLGFSVTLDPAKAQILGTPGEYAWGGAASTAFWCDPVEDMAVVLLTQLMPSSTYPIRRELRVLSYQAIVD